jgi:hypothetical protein
MGSALHLQSSFWNSYGSGDGKSYPSTVLPSIPSICNDGEHFPSFLFSSPPETSAMMESASYPKILHFLLPIP